MMLTMDPACSFARQTTAFSVRGRPKSIFIGVSLIKCPRDEQGRPAESQGASRKGPRRASAGVGASGILRVFAAFFSVLAVFLSLGTPGR